MSELPEPLPRPTREQEVLRRARRRRRLLVLLGTAAAIVAHWLYWYAPRERSAVPSPPFEQLLAGDGAWDRVLWIAHPHQNLGAIDQALGSLDDYLAELARVGDLEAPKVPRFGPFSVPPAAELALGWTDDGRRLLGVARVHRGVGLLARLAGWLAGNPWLAGGEAASGGHAYRVRWQGALWIVESGDSPAWEVDPRRSAAGAERIAEIRLATPVGAVPAGRFELLRGEDGLEVRSSRSGSEPSSSLATAPGSDALLLDLPELALWVAVADRAPLGGPGLFLLWEEPDALLPRVAVLQRGPGRAFRLPGESLLELVGKAEPGYRLDWSVRGTDRRARREGLRIVPWLERSYPRPGGQAAWLAAAGRLAPRRAARMLGKLAGELRKFPLTPRREIERAEAAVRLLA
ncbi:MAG: hypothetical protein R2862_11825, partial [Thermoanaerobaculia bacterium]